MSVPQLMLHFDNLTMHLEVSLNFNSSLVMICMIQSFKTYYKFLFLILSVFGDIIFIILMFKLKQASN